MKALPYIVASLVILACGALFAFSFWIPRAESAQAIVEPYVCPEGWDLTLNTYSCDMGSECSEAICASPDGLTSTRAWQMEAISISIGCGAMLVVGAMIVLIVLMAIRGSRTST